MEFKVVVLGDKGVGKTSLVLRFIEGYFIAKQQSTIGAFFLTKMITATNGTKCKMQLWDTAGQERFRAMAPMYYRNAAAAIICFDITNEDSFAKMKEWVEELQLNVPADQITLAIACNKCDCEENRVVEKARAEEFGERVNAVVFETSAKANIGVEDLFKRITEEVLKKKGADAKVGSGAATVSVINGAEGKSQESSSSGCC
jgi:small GTP-binding protein